MLVDGGAVAAGRVIVEGGTGGTSSISGYIEATGGTGGYINSVPGSHHSGAHGNSDPNGGIGGTPNGRNGSYRYDSNEGGGRGPCPPGKGWALSLTKKDGTYGQGGLARHLRNIHSVWVCCATGGSGGYDTKTISVTPGQVLTIQVGEGGSGISAGLDRYAHICWAEPGNDGFVLLQYEAIRKDYYLNTTTTVDESATDKFAPAVLELFLNGIKGDKTKYEIGIVTEDYGTVYEHYVTGTNLAYGMTVNSNILETEVITGLAGYSWKMDNDEYGQPDNIIGYDNDGNATTEFPKTIATSYLDKGNFLHVRAIDGAGNVGATVHLRLETVTIQLTTHYNEYTDSNGYGPNYVPLTWKNSDTNNKYHYRLFQKNENQSEWTQVSTNYGKSVKVLNVYPNVGNQLKGWMENPNSEEPKGYGKGLISVDQVRISDFNKNPESYLKKDGDYQYDVIMFGSWDCNNGYDISKAAYEATDAFIKTGRGVLFGHDTICGLSGTNHSNFNKLAHYIKAKPVNSTRLRVGSSTVKVIKKGFLTKYPYDIETRNLTVPYAHTSGVLVYSDIWLKFLNLGGPLTNGPEVEGGFNNYYLASWNNCAFIRTGHSNGAATADEQKILANVLFYLGQVTDDTYANVYTAEDLAAPEISNIAINDNKKQNRLEFAIEGIDYGTGYDHYVAGMRLLTAGTYYSNTVHTIVKTGIAKFQYTINSSATEYSGTEFEVKAIDKENCAINIDKSYIGKYLHIRPVDNAGNVGEVTHVYIDGAQTISKEEKDTTEELYCIEEDVLIPSEYDGTSSDATLEVGTIRETLRWPLDLQKMFEIYKQDGIAIRNPYTISGLNGFVDKTNSLGRYFVSNILGTQPGKKGNAREVYAYILSHYNDNNTEDSESQNALYEIIAEEQGKTGDIDRRNTLYYEAKEYAKYRELLNTDRGFFTEQENHNVQVGYNLENEQFIIGPFEVNYIRSQTTIRDEKGNTKKVEFSGIGVANGTTITNSNGIRIYDQNGNEVPQSQWSLEYDDKAEKESNRIETYEEYPMPLPEEEFYIKLNKSANVTAITKIEVEYYEMSADAQYRILSGVYNTVEWNAESNANMCSGGTLCPHNRVYPHTIGHTYYIESEVIAANMDSQDLLEVEWAERGYQQHIQKLRITSDKEDNNGDNDGDGEEDTTLRLTMDFSGSIWNDQNENSSNGLKETGEQGIKGVEVFLIDLYTNKQIDYTVTNENGEYIFKNVPVGIYYIEYTYDGQTYRTTKSFVKGSVEDYRENGNGTEYASISIIDETSTAREKLNNKFYEIKENEAIGRDGAIIKLQYEQIGTTSKIITKEEDTEIALKDFQISVDTKQKDIYFPATNTFVVNGIPYFTIDDNNNINVGLSEREKTDTNLRLDVYQTTFSIKGQTQSFLHNGRDIRILDSNKIVNEYIQKINPDDYYWRIEDYKEKVKEETYNQIINIYGNNEKEAGDKLELETYVEYMIILRNSGENDTAFITELADYYDKSLYYNPNGYRDFDMSSWIVIRNDDETESEYTGNNTRHEIKWSTNSRYGDKNEYDNQFNKMYANIEDHGIQKGQYAEVHIIFQVLKDNNGNIMLDSEEGKKNVAEINGYRTKESSTGNIAGLIDLDSKPGDVNPTQDVGVYEDDEDKAPNYKLVLDTEANSGSGNTGSGNGNDGNGNDGSGEDIKTDENGNVIGFGNTIEGNVWEDLKDYNNPLEDGRLVSNGIKEENEPLINDIKVELLETLGGVNKAGVYQEIEINLCEKNEVRTTNNVLLLTDKANSNGAYRFSHLTAGKYRIRFTYGDETQLTQELKYNKQDYNAEGEYIGKPSYNGQDYQALSSEKINKTDKVAGSYEESEIMIVIDNSNSMSGVKMNHAKLAANNLVKNLKDRLPGIQIGIVNFNEFARTIGKVSATSEILENGINSLTAGGETAISKGITEGINGFEDGKIKLMVLITDGHETVETEEVVINKIEELRNNKIKLVTMLTSESKNIFGDKQSPRYGNIYQIDENANIEAEFNNAEEDIYQEIIEQSQIETDRSLGDDIEGDIDTPRTRWYQINRYTEMDYEKSKELDIEGIRKLTDGSATKIEAIKKLDLYTSMESVTKKIQIEANNIGKNQIHEINQALVERPKAELKLTQEIAGIKITLSDGTVLIDTAKGITKNVNGLEQERLPISIYMDEEIMHGATVEVTYSLKIINVGEVDRLSNYFEGASDSTIPTTAKVIYAYLNNNIVYRKSDNSKETEEGNKEETWNVATEDNWEIELSPDTVEGLDNIAKITLRTTSLEGKPLYPEKSKEVKNAQENCTSEVGVELTLSKLISPEDESSTTLTYDCTMELTVRGNEVGRRIKGSVLGNHRVIDLRDIAEGTTISLEPDETMTRSIIITKPFGENLNNNYILYMAGLCVIIATSLGGIMYSNKGKK